VAAPPVKQALEYFTLRNSQLAWLLTKAQEDRCFRNWQPAGTQRRPPGRAV
jgi:hypothetical protein